MPDTDSVLSTYKPETYAEWARWKGEGPAPASWWANDPAGVKTKVYRSYADYCDD